MYVADCIRRTTVTISSPVFVNNDMLVDPNIIPHVEVLQANIAQRFGFNPYSLQQFLASSYDVEVNELADIYLLVRPVNVSQIHYIYQVLVHSHVFDHDTPICRRLCSLICQTGKVKNQILSLNTAMYCMLNDRGTYDIHVQFEHLQRQWWNGSSRTRGRAWNTTTSVTPLVKFKCCNYFSRSQLTMWWKF